MPLSTNHPSREPRPPLFTLFPHLHLHLHLYPLNRQPANLAITAAELYDDLSTRARGASEEVLAFNSLFVESHTVFDHANASREQNPEGIQSVSVYEMFYADEEGTAVEEVKQAEEDTEMKDGEEGDDEEEEEEEEEVIEDTKEEDVDGVIAEFKRVIEDVVVDIQVGDSGRAVKVAIGLPPLEELNIDISGRLHYHRQQTCFSPSTSRHSRPRRRRQTPWIRPRPRGASSSPLSRM